jgi:pectate lyase
MPSAGEIELKGTNMSRNAKSKGAALRLGLIAILSALAAMPVAAREVPAFPGAEGFGAKATGGRGGRVIAVTNLDDSGPGSLRAAVDAKGPRTIVFRVSGNIALKSSLKLRHGDLTIAGQTAPGDGICLQNYSLDLAGASNVIIRYLRIRPGDSSGKGLDALGGRSGENIIIDHCSMSWSIDECVSIYSAARNITVQWCLMSESLYQSAHAKGHHGFGGIWGGQGASWHHNLLAHHSSRNPRIVGKSVGGQLLDLRNNVIYNWGYNSTYGGDGDVRVNLINNVYQPGPATRQNVRARVANPSKGEIPNNWWIAGNLVIGSPEVTADNWLGVHPSGGVPAGDFRASKPFEVAPVTTHAPEKAFELALKLTGAILPRRDSLDARIVEEARTGTARFGGTYGDGKGIIDSPATVGGWPELKSLPAPKDSDGDGMPDEWELKHGLDPHDPTDGPQDMDKDGYTNLEEYLNGTDPAVFVDYTKPENNVNPQRHPISN